MDVILYSKIQKINKTMYGEPGSVLTPTRADLNFADGATKFTANEYYDTFYVPVRKGEVIVWSYVPSDQITKYIRPVFSTVTPANNVNGTQIVPQIQFIGQYSFTYTAEEDGYFSIAAYEDTLALNEQEYKKPKTDYGLSGLTSIKTDILATTKEKLNAPGTSDGSFETGNSYTTKCFRVRNGCDYDVTLTVTNSTSQFRMVYSLEEPANNGQFHFLQKIEKQAYSSFTEKIHYGASADGFVSFAYYSAEGCTCEVTVIEIESGELGELEKQVEQVSNEVRGLAGKSGNIGKLFLHSDALQVTNDYCEMKQWTVVPYRKMVLNVNCPNNVAVWFVLRVDPYTESNDLTTDPIMNGGEYVVEDGYSLYKIRFAYANNNGGTIVLNGAVSVLDAKDMIEKGVLSITYTGTDIISDNSDVEKEIWARIKSNPIITHTSDTHGDAERYSRFMEISEHYGVNCAINSGDVANVSASDGYQYFTGEIEKHPNIPTIVCMGNHDTYSTNESAYTNFYKPFADAYDYELSTAKTYYYVDLDDADLRIIVLNIYEPRHPGYQNCITKDQIDWFIDTLEGTPAGYGVIVVAHCSEKLIEKDNSYPNFYSDNAPSDWTTRFDNITGNPISTIIDAFISGTTVTGSYTQEIKDTENPSTTVEVTVNYSADFTSKNTGAEFIAYINGHTHYDMIGYLSDTTNPQLSLNITHGAGGQFYNTQDDVPRGNGRGSVQDAFNLYAIDRTAGKVVVCRIGSNKTYDLTDRKIMEIPYK